MTGQPAEEPTYAPQAVIAYARPTWDEIRAAARKTAARQIVAACYFVFLATLILLAPLACAGVRFAWIALIGCCVAVLMWAVGYLVALGAYRGTIERECRKNGLCDRCGYDLRATADRCPECGKRVRAAREAGSARGGGSTHAAGGA